MPTLIPSVGLEYEWMLDTDHEANHQSTHARTLYVPLRLRFVGIGTNSARFFMNVALGYVRSWDLNQPAVFHEGSSLDSSGGFLDLGASGHFPLSSRFRLEAGVALRSVLLKATNGLVYVNEASQVRYMAPSLSVELQYVFLGSLE
ncbi:MAG: hypothetical protein R3B13_17890 [Polyangiaceae bacterium]